MLAAGSAALSEILGVEPPELEALLVADADWNRAPRENERPYPPGLPYFTRAASPRPGAARDALPHLPASHRRYVPLCSGTSWRTPFCSREPLPRTPAWLRELVPQALSAAVARRTGLPLERHLEKIDRKPGFTARSFGGRADAGAQMAFQNLLLALGDAAVEEFGEGFLESALARALGRERRRRRGAGRGVAGRLSRSWRAGVAGVEARVLGGRCARLFRHIASPRRRHRPRGGRRGQRGHRRCRGSLRRRSSPTRSARSEPPRSGTKASLSRRRRWKPPAPQTPSCSGRSDTLTSTKGRCVPRPVCSDCGSL